MEIYQQKYLRKWEDLVRRNEIQLEPEEYGVQMINHSPYYFITNYGRVFSVYKWTTEWRELKRYKKQSANSKRKNSSANRQPCVTLRISGKMRLLRISRLMREYFPLSSFNPADESEMECHHMEPVDDAFTNNHVDNLQMVGKKAHKKVLTPIQAAKLDGYLRLKDEKRFLKSIGELGAASGKPFAVLSVISEETGEPQKVWGEELTEERAQRFLQEFLELEEVQEQLRDVYERQEKRQTQEIMELLRSGDVERIRVKDGKVILLPQEKESDK